MNSSTFYIALCQGHLQTYRNSEMERPRKSEKGKKEAGATEGSRQRGRRPKRVDPDRIVMRDLRVMAREEQCNEQSNW